MNHEKHEKHERLLYADEAFLIQGAIFEVSRVMGIGFLDPVYQECLAIEFSTRRLPFRSQAVLSMNYKDTLLRQTYVADFICFDKIIVELKAVRESAPAHRAQLMNYMRATGMRLGLLVNFGCAPKARIERFIL